MATRCSSACRPAPAPTHDYMGDAYMVDLVSGHTTAAAVFQQSDSVATHLTTFLSHDLTYG